MQFRPWHTLSVRTCAQELDTSIETGLTSIEAAERLVHYGRNELPTPKQDTLLTIFARQFTSPLVYLLLAASIIAYGIHHYTDAVFILVVLLGNAIVGSIQEGRANNALATLTRVITTNTTILRDNTEIIIPDTQLVPGDIVLLKEGEKIAADIRIIDSKSLLVDQSSLTGESLPASKNSDTLRKKSLPYPEQSNILFKGTFIVAGVGRGIVVNTGLQTVIGTIGKTLARIDQEIPLQSNLRHLSWFILSTTLIITFIVVGLGILKGVPLLDILLTAVSLAVSIIPEGLPVVLTIILASGVWRMSRHHALVKRLQSVESLGQADIIAVDKTGTITKNQLVVRSIFTTHSSFHVTGDGYNPKGDIIPVNHHAPYKALDHLLVLGSVSANAHVLWDEIKQQWNITGDPTEAALLVATQKRPIDIHTLEHTYKRIGELPFDYHTRLRATFHRYSNTVIGIMSGAPESILTRSNTINIDGVSTILNNKQRREIQQRIHSSISKGLRVIAIATCHYPSSSLPQNHNELSNLVFEGFFALEDTLREGVKEAVQQALNAGIRVVMLTGDHALTAQAIAREAGIYTEGQTVLVGDDIEKLSDHDLSTKLTTTSVIARLLPEQKLRIIECYHQQGNIVAMTGDGVNDAPALALADLGIAMGRTGSDVAKEAADIVLVDDNIRSIISAIREGRTIYLTLQRVILYLFSTNTGEVITLVGALLLGYPIPLFASQILWLNLITDGFLTIALAREPSHTQDVPKKNILNPLLLIQKSTVGRLLLMATIMGAGSLILYSQYLTDDITKVSTLILTTMAIFQWANAWNCRSHTHSIFVLTPFKNLWLVLATIAVVALQLFAVYSPFMNRVLHTTPLSLHEWLVAIVVASTIILVEEFRKLIHRSISKSHH